MKHTRIAHLRQVEARNLSRSNVVALEEWKLARREERLFENISRLTAALE